MMSLLDELPTSLDHAYYISTDPKTLYISILLEYLHLKSNVSSNFVIAKFGLELSNDWFPRVVHLQ